MKVTVTPICSHPDGYSNSGDRLVGQHAIISRDGVWLDGEKVVSRDRRAKVNREAGHPWIAGVTTWTGFRVDVEP